ncbi:MAG: glycerophosphodiester phosphodiesterase [Treponema sp.]|jgi:glycerophosphoryl diester phosphodiesterase|nr:glycerophosphodiester phosphodiesterase [Treponema sp.]
MIPLLAHCERPLIFAHRGCSSLAPENTMASFRKARELGSPGLELDVHVCASGDLVVAHDDTFERTAYYPYAIEQLKLEDIRKLDVGSFFDTSFWRESPPLLQEVLEEFCPDCYIDIELKTRKTKQDPLPGLVADMLRTFGEKVLTSVTVSSFNPIALLAFKKLCPTVPTAIIWCSDKGVPWFLRYGFGAVLSHCDYLKPIYSQVNMLFPIRFRKPVIPWTVDKQDIAERMLDFGCVGIITNYPQQYCHTV